MVHRRLRLDHVRGAGVEGAGSGVGGGVCLGALPPPPPGLAACLPSYSLGGVGGWRGMVCLWPPPPPQRAPSLCSLGGSS